MKIRRDPHSNGAQFLNIFSLQFDDIEFYLQYALDNQFIDSADEGQADIVYKATIPSSVTPEDRLVLIAEGMRLNETGTLKEFFQGINTQGLRHKEIYYPNPFVVDWERKLVYLKNVYDVEPIIYPEGKVKMRIMDKNNVQKMEIDMPTSIHHIWNFFDEFGLLLDTPRLYGERNRDYKIRLLDVFRHPANSTKEGLQHSLARDLGLWENETWLDGGVDMVLKHANIVMTSIEVDGKKWNEADTYHDRSDRLVLKGNLELLGTRRDVKFIAGLATHTFYNKADYAFREELYSVDRLATPMLQYYVDVITNQVPVMWGQFIWNESFWDIADVKMSGYGYIPSFNDARFLNWSKYKE